MAAAAAPKSSRDEILQFLEDLDTLGPNATTAATSTAHPAAASNVQANDTEAQDALNFLNELTQRSSTPLPPAANPPRSSSDLKRVSSKSSLHSLRAATPNAGASASPMRAPSPSLAPQPRPSTSELPPAAPQPAPTTKHAPFQSTSGTWGWSSVWNSASSVLQQARDVADHNLNLQSQQEQAKKWTGNVLGTIVSSVGQMDLEQVRSKGLKAMTDIINAVAPPISEHEVIQVWLSHDMLGYEGVETLVYRALAKVMEQVEGGELHVNKGSSDQPDSSQINDDDRNLNAVEGFEEARKMAEAELEALLKRHPFNPDESSPSNSNVKRNPDLPITVCPIYLRIQPLIAPYPYASSSTSSANAKALFFLFLFKDVRHSLEHSTLTQALPASWLDIPFEENEWVENEMVEVIRKGVEVLGQDYIRTRQYGREEAVKAAHAEHAAAQGQADQQHQSPPSNELAGAPSA